MEDFTVTTRLTAKEYAKIMLVGLYKKPVFILGILLGLYLLTMILLDYLGIVDYYNDKSLLTITFGLFLLAAPALLALIAVRQFTSNPNFQHDAVYTFGDGGVTIKCLTFKSELLWTHIIKQKEMGKFLVLYHTKRAGNFIDKTKLTLDQLNFIKAKIAHK